MQVKMKFLIQVEHIPEIFKILKENDIVQNDQVRIKITNYWNLNNSHNWVKVKLSLDIGGQGRWELLRDVLNTETVKTDLKKCKIPKKSTNE